MIVIEQEYYREKLVGIIIIDSATTNTTVDFCLFVLSQLFVFKIYNSQQEEWNKRTSLFNHHLGK